MCALCLFVFFVKYRYNKQLVLVTKCVTLIVFYQKHFRLPNWFYWRQFFPLSRTVFSETPPQGEGAGYGAL